jgi:hypothetical protein
MIVILPCPVNLKLVFIELPDWPLPALLMLVIVCICFH